jgi:hypothetical protein
LLPAARINSLELDIAPNGRTFREATVYFRDGLKLARQMDYKSRIIALLDNWVPIDVHH